MQPADLGRKEEPEAHELFDLACDELGLTPTLPAHPGAARWKLVRWLNELIVAGQLGARIRRSADLARRLAVLQLPGHPPATRPGGHPMGGHRMWAYLP